jgi:hypothetical protein
LWVFSPTIVMTCAYGLHLQPVWAALAALPTPVLIALVAGLHGFDGQGVATAVGYLASYPVLTLGVAMLIRFMRDLGERLQLSEAQVAEQVKRQERASSDTFIHEVLNDLETGVESLYHLPQVPPEAVALASVSRRVRDLLTSRRTPMSPDEDALKRSVDSLAADLRIRVNWTGSRGWTIASADAPAVEALTAALRELLRNGSKHGRATEARVRLKVTEAAMEAHVELPQAPGTAIHVRELAPESNPGLAPVLGVGGAVTAFDAGDSVHLDITVPRQPSLPGSRDA